MRIDPAPSFRGRFVLPGDKSISHRAAILGAMAHGQTRIRNFASAADCASTLGCLRALGVEIERDGTVQVSASMQTGCPGVFAGGDMVPSDQTVTVGVGHGKKAARYIHVWLGSA